MSAMTELATRAFPWAAPRRELLLLVLGRDLPTVADDLGTAAAAGRARQTKQTYPEWIGVGLLSLDLVSTGS